MSDTAAEIKSRIRLSEIVGRKVRLVRRGRDLKGLCPFHQEKTPSFHVHDDRGYYKCFGCGASGDVFTFLEQSEGLDFREALEQLAALAGVELPDRTPQARQAEERKKTLHDALDAACAFFRAELQGARGGAARAYLEKRGLGPPACADFRLGYAPGGGRTLIEHLEKKGFPLALLIEAGLASAPEGKTPRDFFFNRVTFPILDLRGRTIGFGARTLDPDGQPKYLNSPKTAVFDKSATLYNHAAARAAARNAQSVIVAEGYMDVIALVRAGFAHTVAPLGTALTDQHLQALWRMAAEPVLCFDGDAAGLTAAFRAIDRALPLLVPGQSLRFALLPHGQDPDDLLRADGPAAMTTVLEAARPLSEMLWQREMRATDLSTPERRAGFERRIEEVAGTIRDAKVRGFYLQEFRTRLNALLRPAAPPRSRGYAKGPPGRPGRGGPGQPRLPVPAPSLRLRQTPAARRDAGDPASRLREELLVLTLVHHPGLLHSHLETAAGIEISARNLDNLRGALIDHAARGGALDRDVILTHLTRCGLADAVARLEARPLWRAYPFAAPGAEPSAAEAGWLDMVALHRASAASAHEWSAAVHAYANDGSEASYERQRALDPDTEGA